MAQKEIITNQKNYYAAANSGKGFYSLFDNIFSPEKLKKIYILKGGPGCGKSTTIRRISEKATDLGYITENYFCSSSPMSYDGVIIPELSVAVIDGTAPHAAEPVYPAVCENIVDLGKAWDTVKAAGLDQEIRQLIKDKKTAYTKAYAYLSSCHGADDVIAELRKKYLLESKMSRAVERLCSKLKLCSGNGNMSKVYTDCISGIGNRHLDTFERMAGTRFFIKDHADISPVFFDCLVSELAHRNADITVALDPLTPSLYRGVYINDAGISFTMYDDDFCIALDRKAIQYKIINTARFCDNDALKRNKVFYKYADKSRKILMSGAVKQLSLAGELHDKTESLYHTITDFSKTEKIAEALENIIFA